MTVHTTSSAATTSLGKKNTSSCGSGGAPVKVCLRLRPMNKLEYARRSKNFAEVHYDTDNSLTIDSPLDGEFDFTFDKVFDETANVIKIYIKT